MEMPLTPDVPLKNAKEVTINGKKFRIGKIPSIPGIYLWEKCSSLLGATRAEDVDMKSLIGLLAFVEIERDKVWYRLDNENAIILYLTTEDVIKVCIEAYAYNFGFFIVGGSRSLMEPIFKLQEAGNPPSDTKM